MTKACGHCFHEKCLSKALKVRKTCPICRKDIGIDYQSIEAMQSARFLNQTLNDIMVRCPFECGAEVKWKSVKDHVRNDCSKALFACQYDACNVQSQRDFIIEHE